MSRQVISVLAIRPSARIELQGVEVQHPDLVSPLLQPAEDPFERRSSERFGARVAHDNQAPPVGSPGRAAEESCETALRRRTHSRSSRLVTSSRKASLPVPVAEFTEGRDMKVKRDGR